MEDTKTKVFSEAGEIKFLTPENCVFSLSSNSFLMAEIDKGDRERVYLFRVFPHDMLDKYITVTDADKNEKGIIKDINVFPEEIVNVLRRDLERRYFIPKILEISSLEEKFGNSYWDIKTDVGERVITVLDTFKNILRIGEDRAIVVDEHGNRYEIESLSRLDKKSMRRIELFL